MHNQTEIRDRPDKITRSELEAIGLGDPTDSLRRTAFGDLFIIAFIYVAALLVALALDLGDMYHAFVVAHEEWEVDEFILAGILTLIALVGFSWRQWLRYSDEISRRLKLEKDLVAMRVLADNFGENKELFLSNLAHDFRTPLNGIIGFTQLLEEEPFGPIGNEHYKTYVATIRESADMLSDRIMTCLDPEKIEFGAEPMQMMPFPLKKAVVSSLPIIRALAQSGDITVEDEIRGNLPDIHGDARAIKKVIINLATSAIKHCRRHGKVCLSAAATDDGGLKLEIADDGVGMDATVIMTLKQHEPGTKNPRVTADGQGAGLFAAKALLDMHDASLMIENRLGHGTVATVAFPESRLIRPTDEDDMAARDKTARDKTARLG